MLVTLRPGTPQGRLTSPWRAAAIVLLGLAVLACGSPPQRATESRAQGGAVAQQPAIKRITLGVLGDPPVLFNSIGTASGADDTGEELVSRGLVEADDTRTFRPLLAEDIPTIENGLWQVFPDGRMRRSPTSRRTRSSAASSRSRSPSTSWSGQQLKTRRTSSICPTGRKRSSAPARSVSSRAISAYRYSCARTSATCSDGRRSTRSNSRSSRT